MTEADLDEVEAALGRPLPADYRQFVRDCSVADWNRHCVYFYASAKDMIRENRAMPLRGDDTTVREPDGGGGFLPERPWPADWTVIGDGDSEWYTFVRPDKPGVWEWEHSGREVTRVAASFAAFLAASREKKGPAPEPETSVHPTLGEVSWDPEDRRWTARPAGSPRVILDPRGEDRDAFLSAVAGLVVAAVAAEPRVFAEAMAAGGWEEFLERTDGETQGLTADTVRGQVEWRSLVVRPGPTVEYHYQPADELGFDLLWVEADGALAVQGQGWVR